LKVLTPIEIAQAAFDIAERSMQALDWENARQACEKIPAGYQRVVAGGDFLLFDCLLHLHRFNECREAAQKLLATGGNVTVFGTCWVAIITTTHFLDGKEAALEHFKKMGLALLEIPNPGLFRQFSFLKRHAGDPTLPRCVAVFCDNEALSRVNDGYGRHMEHITLFAVFEMLLELILDHPDVFHEAPFKSILLMDDGKSISWQDAIGKVLVPRNGAAVRVLGAYVPIHANPNNPGTTIKVMNVDCMGLLRSQWLNDTRMLAYYASGAINPYEMIKFWVVETGCKHLESRTAAKLHFFSPANLPRQQYYRRRRARVMKAPGMPNLLQRACNTIIPACKSCDSALTFRLPRSLSRDEKRPKSCPFCGTSLEVYWRGAKAYLVQLANPTDFTAAGRWNSIPITDRNMTKHVPLRYHEIQLLTAEMTRALEQRGLGPVDINIKMKEGGNIQISCEPASDASLVCLGSRTWEPGYAIPAQLVRRDGCVEERLLNAQQEISKILAEQAKKKQALIDKQNLIKALPGEIIDFWTRYGFLIESANLDNRRKKLTVSIDGIYLKGHLPDGSGQRPLSIANYTGMEIERFTFKSKESRLFTGCIETQLSKFSTGIFFRAVEQGIRSRHQAMTQSQKLIPEYNANRAMNRRRKVMACEACGAMYMRYAHRHMQKTDHLSSPACPYCKAQTRLAERRPEIVHLDFDPPIAPPRPSWQSRRFQFVGVKYHGLHVDLLLNARARHMLLLGIQDQFKNHQVGPLKLDLVYSLRKAVSASVSGAMISAIKPGTLVQEIEWRPAFELPEDKSAI
jgi:hypothetical protein